jgi:uncharacterized DUF497 family protein
MEIEFIFRHTAFKHNVSEADIHHAFETCVYTGQFEEGENVYLLIGFDMDANLIEILYNYVDDNTVSIFHAMSCQTRFLYLIEEGGLYND